MSTTSWPPKRIALLAGIVVLIPVLFIGGCVVLMVGVGMINAGDDARARAAAEANPRPLVSSDGRIVFSAVHDGSHHMFVVNVDGSGLTQLTRPGEGTLESTAPVVSPDGTRLAISANNKIAILRIDHAGERTQLDRPGGSLAWSPDGRQLASLSIDAGKRLHLWIVNVDGTGDARDVASSWPSTADGERQFVNGLAWSPDGKRLGFALSTRYGYRRALPLDHLYVAQSDGSGLTNQSRTARGQPAYGALAWSPDGRRLAFYGGHGIVTVDVDSRWTDILIPPHETGAFQRPAWSPDGSKLAWFDYYSIIVSDPAGQHQDVLTRGRCRGVHPAWSSDGQRIAFVCRDGEGRQNVFVMNADGSGLTPVTRFTGRERPEYPVWLPTSR